MLLFYEYLNSKWPHSVSLGVHLRHTWNYIFLMVISEQFLSLNSQTELCPLKLWFGHSLEEPSSLLQLPEWPGYLGTSIRGVRVLGQADGRLGVCGQQTTGCLYGNHRDSELTHRLRCSTAQTRIRKRSCHGFMHVWIYVCFYKIEWEMFVFWLLMESFIILYKECKVGFEWL